MHPFHIEVLRCNHQLLEQYLKLEGTNILSDLIKQRIITEEHKSKILDQRSSVFQNNVLLAYLRRCPYDMKPFETFIEALQISHHNLAQAVLNTLKDKEIHNRLQHLKTAWVCDRCVLVRYLDPYPTAKVLLQNDLLGLGLFKEFKKQCNKSQEDQAEILLGYLLMRGGPLTNSKRCRTLKCLGICFKGRGSKDLHNRLRALATKGSNTCINKMHKCECRSEVSENDRDALRQKALMLRTANSQCPLQATGGEGDIIYLLTHVSFELNSNLIFGRWQQFQDTVDELKQAYPGNSGVGAMIVSYSILKHYCRGNPKEGLALYSEFEQYAASSPSETFLRLTCDAIMAGVYRATKQNSRALETVIGALQEGYNILPNKAIAYLHERLGITILHGRDPVTGEVLTPSSQCVFDRAANALHESFYLYRKVSEESAKSRYDPSNNPKFVNDHSAWMLYEVKFWPLIEFVATKLGSCLSGHYVHPDPVSEENWTIIDKVIAYISLSEPLLSPSRKCRFFFVQSDYHLRTSEVSSDSDDAQRHLLEATRYAEKASKLRKDKNLKPAMEDMVNRRRKRIHARLQKIIKRYLVFGESTFGISQYPFSFTTRADEDEDRHTNDSIESLQLDSFLPCSSRSGVFTLTEFEEPTSNLSDEFMDENQLDPLVTYPKSIWVHSSEQNTQMALSNANRAALVSPPCCNGPSKHECILSNSNHCQDSNATTATTNQNVSPQTSLKCLSGQNQRYQCDTENMLNLESTNTAVKCPYGMTSSDLNDTPQRQPEGNPADDCQYSESSNQHLPPKPTQTDGTLPDLPEKKFTNASIATALSIPTLIWSLSFTPHSCDQVYIFDLRSYDSESDESQSHEYSLVYGSDPVSASAEYNHGYHRSLTIPKELWMMYMDGHINSYAAGIMANIIFQFPTTDSESSLSLDLLSDKPLEFPELPPPPIPMDDMDISLQQRASIDLNTNDNEGRRDIPQEDAMSGEFNLQPDNSDEWEPLPSLEELQFQENDKMDFSFGDIDPVMNQNYGQPLSPLPIIDNQFQCSPQSSFAFEEGPPDTGQVRTDQDTSQPLSPLPIKDNQVRCSPQSSFAFEEGLPDTGQVRTDQDTSQPLSPLPITDNQVQSQILFAFEEDPPDYLLMDQDVNAQAG